MMSVAHLPASFQKGIVGWAEPQEATPFLRTIIFKFPIDFLGFVQYS